MSLSTNRGIQFVIGVQNRWSAEFGKLNAELKSVSKAADKIGASFTNLGFRMGAFGAAGGWLTGVTDIPGNLAQFQHGLQELGNIGEITADQLTSVSDEIRRVALSTNQMQLDVLAGTKNLIAQGLDPRMAIGAMEDIGRTATATVTDIESLSNTAFVTMNTLKVPVSELGKAFDVMTASANEGNFELRDMAMFFPTVTASARNLGIEGTMGVARLGAALQISRLGAQDAGQAANNFMNFLTKILSSETRQKLMMVGVDINKIIRQAMADPTKDVIEESVKAIQDVTKGDQLKIPLLFRDMQVLAFLNIMTRNMERYRQIRDESFRKDGVIDRQYAAMMTTHIEKWKKFKIQIQDVGMTVGFPVLEKVGVMMGFITKHTTLATAAFTAFSSAIVGGGVLIALGMILRSFKEIISVVDILTKKEITLALVRIAGAMGPAGLAILGGVAAGAGIAAILSSVNYGTDEKQREDYRSRYDARLYAPQGRSDSAFMDKSKIEVRVVLDNAPPGTRLRTSGAGMQDIEFLTGLNFKLF